MSLGPDVFAAETTEDDLRVAIQLVAEVNEIEAGRVAEPDMSWFTQVVASGGSLDKQDSSKKKETPLIRAIHGSWLAGGMPGVVKVLLAAGADVHATDWFNNTPLHHAAYYGEPDSLEQLLRAGAEVDALNDFKSTPLNDMCTRSIIEGPDGSDLPSPRFAAIARMLIEAGTNLDSQDNNGCTPLNNVCYRGGASLARQLIEAGATVDIPNNKGFSPLHAACEYKHHHVVYVLLESGADLNLRDNCGFTALHGAAAVGESRIVSSLLRAGANAALLIDGEGYEKAKPGMTAADVAFAHGHRELAVQLAKAVPQDPGVHVAALVVADCNGGEPGPIRASGLAQYVTSGGSLDTHKPGPTGYTPLILAASAGSLDAVKALVTAGANIHTGDTANTTPVHHAAAFGEDRIVAELVKSAPSVVHAVNDTGATPLTYVCQHAEADLYAESERPSLYTYQATAAVRLIEAGANVDHQDHEGKSPLHHASASGHRGLVTRLIKAGATIDLTDATGATPLHAACANKRYDAVRALLKGGADLNVRDNRGATALHIAAAMGARAPITQLRKAGADPTLTITGDGWDKATAGMTPAQVATAYGYKKLAAALDASQ
ncbi:ankyrin repeat domain-containing protein [Actinocrispum sp. NPDC049592]|uniref:ankyrin repeat domain-containing protein n=1 Tax=Actinocrispum sp. NPDC049592 TaxID=3154835 RepID=UPI00343B6003